MAIPALILFLALLCFLISDPLQETSSPSSPLYQHNYNDRDRNSQY